MATFIITYDTHFGRNYQALYDAMKEHRGVRLAESVWGIVLNNNPHEVRDWARSLLDDDDTIVVIQLRPEPNWASWYASDDATEWMHDYIKARATA